ncbi:hypothetical protein RPSD_15960 [Ralstonia solanacearum]|nr:hypothetical protein RPSD_15960 [Ralstonia solanacearum]
MISATMELATQRALSSVDRAQRHTAAESWLSALTVRPLASVTDWLLSRLVRSQAEQLSSHVLSLRLLLRDIGNGDPVDPALELRGILDTLLERSKKLRRTSLEFLKNSERTNFNHLPAEFRRFVAVAGELIEATQALQWEIAEHDASLARHLDGFVASEAKEVTEMLDRIAA